MQAIFLESIQEEPYRRRFRTSNDATLDQKAMRARRDS